MAKYLGLKAVLLFKEYGNGKCADVNTVCGQCWREHFSTALSTTTNYEGMQPTALATINRRTYWSVGRVAGLAMPSVTSDLGRLFHRRIQAVEMVAKETFITPAHTHTHILNRHSETPWQFVTPACKNHLTVTRKHHDNLCFHPHPPIPTCNRFFDESKLAADPRRRRGQINIMELLLTNTTTQCNFLFSLFWRLL